jgi:hypothetical protein
MDVSTIKAKLDSLQSKGQSKEKIDYSKIFWKPKVGSHQVRIVPSKYDKTNPFREIYLHYGYAKFPMLALTNWGEADPIVEAAKKLRKSDNPEHWQMAKKITPKMRIFVPVIVRGEEASGVRLWEFGHGIYKQLMGIALNEDYGDFTDIQDGRDFTVEAVEADVAGRKGIQCNIIPRVKTTTLSKDAELVTKWLEEQPDILAINRKYTYEDLKDIFEKWANPEEDEEPTTIAETKEDEDEEDIFKEKPAAYEAPVKQSKADKFEDLFDSEE